MLPEAGNGLPKCRFQLGLHREQRNLRNSRSLRVAALIPALSTSRRPSSFRCRNLWPIRELASWWLDVFARGYTLSECAARGELWGSGPAEPSSFTVAARQVPMPWHLQFHRSQSTPPLPRKAILPVSKPLLRLGVLLTQLLCAISAHEDLSDRHPGNEQHGTQSCEENIPMRLGFELLSISLQLG